MLFCVLHGGLPAVLEHGRLALPEGTIVKAKQGACGSIDAPLIWFLEHLDSIIPLPGGEQSELCQCHPCSFAMARAPWPGWLGAMLLAA